MLSVFCGNDEPAVRNAAQKYIAAKSESGYLVTRCSVEDFQPGVVENALGANSLFGEQELFVFDTPSQQEDFNTAVTDNLSHMAASETEFVVIEGALLAAPKKVYTKHATEFEEFKADIAKRFNTFTLADALVAKDKRKLWLLLQEAVAAGLAAEEIIGVLWWQLKTLRLVACTSSASEAGLKEFPYNKAKRALTLFSTDELTRLSEDLLRVYHDGHGGVRDTDLALEKWVLTI